MEKKLLTRKDIENQIESFRKQAADFSERAQQAIGGIQILQHMLATYEFTEEKPKEEPK